MLNLALVISTSIWKFEGQSLCIVELNNELDVRGVVLNLTSLISVSIWKPEEK